LNIPLKTVRSGGARLPDFSAVRAKAIADQVRLARRPGAENYFDFGGGRLS
jgi:hypothetical protein